MPAAAKLKPVYLLAGDESYSRELVRQSLIERIPADLRPLAVVSEDLDSTPLEEILDRALCPSLLAPLQLYFVRGVKELFARATAAAVGKKKHGDFPANIARFAQRAGEESEPWAVVVFIADHLHIPSDRQRMSLDDKTKLERLEQVFAPFAEIVLCAQATPVAAAALAGELAAQRSASLGRGEARYLAELLDSDLGLIATEVEKLALHAAPGGAISEADIRALVDAGRQSSVYELAERVARGERRRGLEALRELWNAAGDEEAIPLCFQWGRILKMALVLRQHRASDYRSVYAVLPDGLRPPPFAVPTILAASRMSGPRIEQGIRRLQEVDMALRSNPLSARMLFEQVVVELTRPEPGAKPNPSVRK